MANTTFTESWMQDLAFLAAIPSTPKVRHKLLAQTKTLAKPKRTQSSPRIQGSPSPCAVRRRHERVRSPTPCPPTELERSPSLCSPCTEIDEPQPPTSPPTRPTRCPQPTSCPPPTEMSPCSPCDPCSPCSPCSEQDLQPTLPPRPSRRAGDTRVHKRQVAKEELEELRMEQAIAGAVGVGWKHRGPAGPDEANKHETWRGQAVGAGRTTAGRGLGGTTCTTRSRGRRPRARATG